jgi:mannan polymerase II complex MNN10 subunit
MSRSPSPRPGGWSSPGLNTPYDTGGRTSPFPNGAASASSNNVTWASAQARSANVQGYTAFAPRNQGFFGKHFRRLSTSLPFSYGEKEKLGRGRGYQGNNKILQMLNRIGWNLWRLRKPLGTILTILLLYILFYATRMSISRQTRRIY